MKKMMTNKFWLMGLMLMACFGFTSCEMDPDEGVGYDVRGRWFGDLDMWMGNEKAIGSDIEFVPRGWGYSYGSGTEIDYYRRATIVNYFDYEIRNGVIYLYFDNPELDCSIRDYRLGYDYFTGYMDGLYESVRFSLRNYDRYWGTYGYDGYYDPYYYVKGEKFTNDSTATSASTSEPKYFRGVNREKED